MQTNTIFAVAKFVVFCLPVLVHGLCPNLCWGHGECDYSKMECNCYNGWSGNDCRDRICAYGYSFTTTPIGDINSDGDTQDSSLQQFVYHDLDE